MKRSESPFYLPAFFRDYIPVCLAVLLVTPAAILFANPKPASPFTDHMVLQRNMAVPVWGTADAGEKITVRFGKQVKSTVAGATGKWVVRLDKLKAGGPFEMDIQGNTLIKFR